MVTATEEHQVLEGRRATVRPMDNVMGVTPRMWAVAVRESALPVPHR